MKLDYSYLSQKATQNGLRKHECTTQSHKIHRRKYRQNTMTYALEVSVDLFLAVRKAKNNTRTGALSSEQTSAQ